MLSRWICALILATSVVSACAAEPSDLHKFVQSHCLDCHDKATHKGDLSLAELLKADIGQNARVWEKVVRRLSARQMPPKDAPRPTEAEFKTALASIESSLDAAAEKSP